MYAQWRSFDEYQAMRQDLSHFHFSKKRSRSPKFEPGVYEVVRTFAPNGEPS
jgi:hypothetical protein